MAESITREEYLKSMERIHSRVDTVERITAAIETSAKNIEKAVCDMRNLMYGSEKADGIITKVSNLWQKVSGIYWLGGVIIVSLIGTLIGLIFNSK